MPRTKEHLKRGGGTVMLRAEIEDAEAVIESLGWALPAKKFPPLPEWPPANTRSHRDRALPAKQTTLTTKAKFRFSRLSFEAACYIAAMKGGSPQVPERFAEYASAFCALTFHLRLSLEKKTKRDVAASNPNNAAAATTTKSATGKAKRQPRRHPYRRNDTIHKPSMAAGNPKTTAPRDRDMRIPSTRISPPVTQRTVA